MVEKYRAMMENGEEIPEKQTVGSLPLAPQSWDPLDPFA